MEKVSPRSSLLAPEDPTESEFDDLSPLGAKGTKHNNEGAKGQTCVVSLKETETSFSRCQGRSNCITTLHHFHEFFTHTDDVNAQVS